MLFISLWNNVMCKIRGYGDRNWQKDIFKNHDHGWVAIMTYKVIRWGHECDEHHEWYHSITGHHSMALTTILWVE